MNIDTEVKVILLRDNGLITRHRDELEAQRQANSYLTCHPLGKVTKFYPREEVVASIEYLTKEIRSE